MFGPFGGWICWFVTDACFTRLVHACDCVAEKPACTGRLHTGELTAISLACRKLNTHFLFSAQKAEVVFFYASAPVSATCQKTGKVHETKTREQFQPHRRNWGLQSCRGGSMTHTLLIMKWPNNGTLYGMWGLFNNPFKRLCDWLWVCKGCCSSRQTTEGSLMWQIMCQWYNITCFDKMSMGQSF